MKIAFSPQQLFDIVGYPLVAGRVKFYLHDSDTLATTYTMDGQDFIEAQNPVILTDTGEFSSTIFLEAAIYDIVVDQLIDGTYAQVKDFEYGFDYPAVKNDTIVNGIAGLADANPELGSVTVVGYDEYVYAGPRTYIWDPNCTDSADGGAIIESNSTLDGRWILCSDLREMPSTYYGVTGGNEANLAAFLTYLPVVGTYHIAMPPVPRFVKGTYVSTGTYSVTKTLSFDPGVEFTTALFVCPEIEVTNNTNSIADFTFTNADVAHSSWFRTVNAFWHCGAATLVADITNYFSDSKLSTNVDLDNKTVIGHASLVGQYLNGSCFIVKVSSTVPDSFFALTDFVRIASTHGDKIFRTTGSWDPGLISAGHHQQYDSVPALSTFISVDRWLAVMIERRVRLPSQIWSDYTIDFAGRSVSDILISADSFQTIRNVTVTGKIQTAASITLENVNAEVQSTSSLVSLVAKDSTIRLSQTQTGLVGINMTNCNTSMYGENGLDPVDTDITVSGGRWHGYIKMSNAHKDAYALGHQVKMRNVVFDDSNVIEANYLLLENCYGDVRAKLLPASDGNGSYLYTAHIVGNHFVGASKIVFGVYVTDENHHNALDGHVKLNYVKIVDNRLDTSDLYGIKLIKYNPKTYNVIVAADYGHCEYHGNSGTCPRMSPGYIPGGDGWETVGTTYRWKVNKSWVFNIWCPYNEYGDGSYHIADDNTGLNPVTDKAPLALWYDGLNDSPDAYAYAYGGIGLPGDLSQLDDEDINNICRVHVGVGMYQPSVPPPAIDNGWVYFPGLNV